MSLNVCFSVKKFRDLIESVKDIVPNGVLSFVDDGMDMQNMDVNKVRLVELFVPAISFESYTFPDEKDFPANVDDEEFEVRRVNIPVDFKSLHTILKVAKADAECEFIYELDSDHLNMLFRSENEEFSFELKLLDQSYGVLTVPERENNVTMTLPSDVYQSFTKDISSLASDLTINVTTEQNHNVLKFEFKSEMGNGSWQLNFNNGIELHEFNDGISQKFAINYLKDFGKAVSNAGRADISMKTDEPIEIVCALANLSNAAIMPDEVNNEEPYPFGYIKFFLAPKIEDN
jgi:proliferating cell nuclear antigen PCNA